MNVPIGGYKTSESASDATLPSGGCISFLLDTGAKQFLFFCLFVFFQEMFT